MNEQNTYGFNPEAITRTVNNMQNAFDTLHVNLTRGIENVFKKLADNWFAPEALTFGEDAHEKISKFYWEMRYDYVERTLLFQASCNSWARTVGSDFYCKFPEGAALGIPFISFKEDNNGFIGVYDQNISDINKDFEIVLNQLTEDIEKLVRAIKTDPSLYGAAQLDAFENYVRAWKGKVSRTFTEVFNEMTTKINQTRERYQSTAQTNAQRFSSGN